MSESGSILTFHKDWWLPRVQPDVIEALVTQLSLSPPIASTLANRNLKNVEEIHDFLHPTLDNLHNPLKLPDIDVAVRRILGAIDRKEQIVIYGHDDVDGMTSALVLSQALHALKGKVRLYIPDRIAEGTGLSWDNLNRFAREGAKLIVTVDCSFEDQRIIRAVKELPADIVLTDHHEVCHFIPKSIPFVNPKRIDSTYPFRDLAGVGVSFKMAQALLCAKRKPLDRFFNRVSDLIALGTLADKVPLERENRVISRLGYDRFQSCPRVGITAILDLFAEVESVHQDFLMRQVIPLLNSSTSNQGQNDGLTLLESESRKRATQLAKELFEASQEWQKVMQVSFKRIVERVEGKQSRAKRAILVIDDETPPKVLGPCASRIMRAFEKPVFILSYSDDRYFGEARAPKGYNLVDLLYQCQDLFINYGGHKQAAGFSLFPEHVDDFRERLTKLIDEIPMFGPFTWRLDSEVDITSLAEPLFSELEMLAPFGRGNPSPTFLSRDVVFNSAGDRKDIGNDMWLGTINGIAVIVSKQGAEAWGLEEISSSSRYDIIFHISIQSGQKPQIFVRDMRRV